MTLAPLLEAKPTLGELRSAERESKGTKATVDPNFITSEYLEYFQAMD